MMNAMSDHKRTIAQGWTLALALCLPLSAYAQKKEFKYTVAPGASITVANHKGNIAVKPAAGRQVVVTGTPASDKVEIDASQAGNRVTVRSHAVGKPSGDEGKVDYEIQVPADAAIAIESGSGDIRLEGVRGGVSIDSEEGEIEVRGVNGGFVQIQSVNGGISLVNVSKARVQVTSPGGNIRMENVSGASVSAKSTSGKITYAGDFGGAGNYLLTNHSGDIEVTMPTTASVDLRARSLNGSVENDFPLQKPAHPAFEAKEGKALLGTSNSASSAVELRSFSGKIRVKKQ
jgi:hypothetical protein